VNPSGPRRLFRGAQPPAIDDAEARFGIVLMQQCDGIDGDPFETVEAELSHDIRVAPMVEIGSLPFARSM
jgi:hypothetical protein